MTYDILEGGEKVGTVAVNADGFSVNPPRYDDLVASLAHHYTHRFVGGPDALTPSEIFTADALADFAARGASYKGFTFRSA